MDPFWNLPSNIDDTLETTPEILEIPDILEIREVCNHLLTA